MRNEGWSSVMPRSRLSAVRNNSSINAWVKSKNTNVINRNEYISQWPVIVIAVLRHLCELILSLASSDIQGRFLILVLNQETFWDLLTPLVLNRSLHPPASQKEPA